MGNVGPGNVGPRMSVREVAARDLLLSKACFGKGRIERHKRPVYFVVLEELSVVRNVFDLPLLFLVTRTGLHKFAFDYNRSLLFVLSVL